MRIKRAKEIIESPNNIKVLYKNNSVWIEDVNEEKETTHVKILDDKQRIEVPVSDLYETGNML